MAFLGHLHVDDIAGDDEWHEDYLIVDVGHTFSLGCDNLNPDILIKRQGLFSFYSYKFTVVATK